MLKLFIVHVIIKKWLVRKPDKLLTLPLLNYALSVCPGITELAVTCLDRLADVREWSICESYEVPEERRDRFFLSGDRAFSLKSGDLTHQERLTDDLRVCTPVFRDVPNDPEGYVQAIREGLLTNLPITVTSHGPTAEDKRWRQD